MGYQTVFQTQSPVTVRQFQVHGAWKEGSDVPNDASAICNLLEMLDRWQQGAGQGKIIIHCM